MTGKFTKIDQKNWQKIDQNQKDLIKIINQNRTEKLTKMSKCIVSRSQYPRNVKVEKGDTDHMWPEGACRLTCEEYWKAGCSLDNIGSVPTTPRPRTVSKVPDRENIRQFRSRS